jgi:hypothetical protein
MSLSPWSTNSEGNFLAHVQSFTIGVISLMKKSEPDAVSGKPSTSYQPAMKDALASEIAS